MVRKNIFVLLGTDPKFKNIHIERIKKKLREKKPSLSSFNLYPDELELSFIQEELENFSFSPRLFIFRNVEILDSSLKNFLLSFLRRRDLVDYFIFDFALEVEKKIQLEKDNFFSFLLRTGILTRMGSLKKELDFKDLSQALRRKDISSSLLSVRVLFKRMRKEKVALQILGLVVKIFSNSGTSIFEKKLRDYIVEADRLLKEGIIEPQVVIELLILRLLLIKKSQLLS